MDKGFTLIEMIVVIAIIAILSAIILFSVTQYIAKGKDSNVAGNLAGLVPAGEVYYNINGNYGGFCSSTVAENAKAQMPPNSSGSCTDNPAGLCCGVDPQNNNKWAACAKKFSDSNYAFCVDSRGVKQDITAGDCVDGITSCD
jgi:prepilin-type N-terminal cleavage/methylation domain-containing protein